MNDELCLVIDRDKQSWTEATISEVAQFCHAKQYILALSNPCFELWLLIHHYDVMLLSEDEKKYFKEIKWVYEKQTTGCYWTI